jgi:hypothetical protein
MSEPALLNLESKSASANANASVSANASSGAATTSAPGSTSSGSAANVQSAVEPLADAGKAIATTTALGAPASHSFHNNGMVNSSSHGHGHSHSSSSRLMVQSLSMVSPGGNRYSLAKMIDASEARMLRLKKLDEFVEDKMEKLSAKIRSDASEGYGQIAVDITDWLDPVYLLVADAFRKQGFRVHFEDKEGVPTDDDDPCGCKMLIDWDMEGNGEMRVEEAAQLAWNEDDMEPQHKR